MGDLGGLLDALYILGEILLSPLAHFALQAQLLSSLFRYRASNADLIKARTQNPHGFSKILASKMKFGTALGAKREQFLKTHFNENDFDEEILLMSLKNDF